MINGTGYHSEIARRDYDAIVIGSGLGGLTCAALLARAGRRVLVLERHYTAGGFTHAFRRRGYEWDVGVHYIGDVHKPHSPMRRVFDAISDGSLHWAKMDPVYDSMLIAGDRYDYHAGVRAFRDGLLQHFPAAGLDIDAYLAHVRQASQGVAAQFGQRLLPRMLQSSVAGLAQRLGGDYFARTTHEVIAGCTRDRRLAAVLAGQWGDYGVPPKRSAFGMHALVAQHYLDGANFPVGGAGSIARAIIPTIEAAGGAVLVGAGVDRILVHRGRAVGVRLRNGDELRCNEVISATGVHTTFDRLLPESVAREGGMLDKVRALPRSVGHLGLYLGLKGTREQLGLEQANLWVYNDYDFDAALQRFLQQPGTDFPLMYLSFPSAKDPAWAQNHPGKSTIDVIAPAPWSWFQRWQHQPWNRRGDDYEAFKQQLAERLIDEVHRQAPRTRGQIDHVELSTPLSTAHFSHYAGGELYGLEHTPYRFAPRFLTPRTPIKGLHLTGQDVLFCGVGSALMSGVLTAATLLGPRLLRVVPDLLAGRSEAAGRWLKRLAKARPVPTPTAAATPRDTAPTWFEAECIGVETLSADCKAFRFRAEAGAMADYRPGQFVTVEAQIGARRLCRSYTLSSSPTRADSVEITVKRVDGGPFSNWICDTLEVGDRLRMSGPFGEFSCAPHPPEKLLLLSAGSGITPMLSMARWIADSAADCDVVFLHAARTRDDILFHRELRDLARDDERFRLGISLSREPADSAWRGARGRLSTRWLRRAVPDLAERRVYLCGPEGFMHEARALLGEAGLPAHRLYEERFDTGLDLAGAGGTVRFAATDVSVASTGRESLLELAEAAGISMPSACRTGHCGECRVRCRGETVSAPAHALSADDETAGYVLACVSAADADLVVEA